MSPKRELEHTAFRLETNQIGLLPEAKQMNAWAYGSTFPPLSGWLMTSFPATWSFN